MRLGDTDASPERSCAMPWETPSWGYGLGCRGDAAEIKPIEPVWVIPAKGAAGCRTAQHAMSQAQRRHHRRRRDRPWHCLAAGHARRYRSRCSTRARAVRREPCGRRDAGRLRRGRAGRGGAGRARARQPGALAGFRGRTEAGVRRSTWNCAREGTLVVALTADDQARLQPSTRIPAQARAAAGMDFGGGDAPARAAPRRQARGRGVQPGRPPGRQPQARRRPAHCRRERRAPASTSIPAVKDDFD